MKTIFLVLAISQLTLAVKPLYSKKIKTQVCTEVEKEFRSKGFRKSSCLKTKMIFSKKSISQKISGQKRPLTTMMFIQFTEAHIKFEVILKAEIEVSSQGKLSRKGWIIHSINPLTYGDKSILNNSWSHSSNVTELADESTLPKATVVKVKKYKLHTGGFDISVSDVETRLYEYFQINHPKTGKVLGYIIHTSFASESEDYNLQINVKFDKHGNFIDDNYESYGYHE